MNYVIDIQHNLSAHYPLDEANLKAWAIQALQPHLVKAELSLYLVEPDEMQTLNHTYRKIDKPTNVLSFPAEYPEAFIELEYPFIGDVVICPAVLVTEAEQLHKTFTAHAAHIVIHGVLHLLGYDHTEEEDTALMQTKEITMLATLGFENPYLTEDDLRE
jgi:probable rRNA maturation factor